jgi:hypothetical protein
MKDIFNEIIADDLSDDLKLIADSCGIETVQNLLRYCGGLSLYIPKVSRIHRFIERFVTQNSEQPLIKLAKQLNVSQNFLRRFRY